MPGINKTANDSSLAPTKRQDVIKNTAKFTSGHASSHLMSLGEFYAMYLFVWSDELWSSLPLDRDLLGDDIVDEYETTCESLFSKTKHKELVEGVREEIKNVNNFKKWVPYVRRVLANIPTYMIFDDHEITDDWNLDGAWVQNTLDPANLLASRIITNGLVAFSIFQAWGNTPQEFSTGTGQQLLNAISQWNGTDINKIDTISDLLGVVDPNSPQSTNRVMFDFGITWSNHRAIVLDTRTWRAFNSYQRGAELISEESLQRQIIDRLSNNTGVEITFIIAPSPVIGISLMEEFIQPLGATKEDIYYADLEAWGSNTRAHQRLLRSLSSERKIIILSGDVHYGFSALCEFWEDVQGTTSIYVQLTSSAIKNEGPYDAPFKGTLLLHNHGYKPLWPFPDSPREFFGWENASIDLEIKRLQTSNEVRPIIISTMETQQPAIIENTLHLYSVNKPPEWCYRLKYFEDSGTPQTQRNTDTTSIISNPPSSPDPLAWIELHKTIAHEQRKRLNEWSGLEIVGRNNIGEVWFEKNPLRIYHTLWWAIPQEHEELIEFAPLTNYEIDISSAGNKPTIVVT